MLEVDLIRLDPELPVPRRAHPDDAGVDLAARADVEVAPGHRALVGTGIALVLPTGYAAFVHPRSGLAVERGLGVLNAPGTVDAGYRGEVRVCLVNHDPARTVTIRRGDRIAQLVVQRVEQPVFCVHEVERAPDGTGTEIEPEIGTAAAVDAAVASAGPAARPSSRGAAGFGSTGVAATGEGAEDA